MAPLIVDENYFSDILSDQQQSDCVDENDGIIGKTTTITGSSSPFALLHTNTTILEQQRQQQQQQQQQQQHQDKKKVSFNDSEILTCNYDVLHRNDYTEQEVKDTWYERTELQGMKIRTRLEAKQLEEDDYDTFSSPSTISAQGTNFDFCLRGLESRTSQGNKIKMTNRYNASASVFFEIDSQEVENDGQIYDPDVIAQIYREYSVHCLVAARQRAVQDELDILCARRTR